MFLATHGIIGGRLEPFVNNNSFSFDGVSSRFEVIDTLSSSTPFRFVNSDKFSFSAWVKVSGGSNAIISNQDVNGVNFRGYYLAVTSSGNLFCILRSTLSDRLVFQGSTSISSGWNHVVFTYDGSSSSNGGQFYINGSTETTTGTGSLTGTMESVSPLFIGTRDNADNFFDGNMDELAIFEKELTSSEVSQIYNLGTPDRLNSFNPSAWFRMGDNATWNGSSWSVSSVVGTTVANSLDVPYSDLSTDTP